MDWTDEPATWRQLKSLKELGHSLGHRLTKVEAANLIRTLGGKPEGEGSLVNSNPSPGSPVTAFQLRGNVEKARQAVSDAGRNRTQKLEIELAQAERERQEFWIDTCREAGKSKIASVQILELYQKHGCRFEPPAPSEVQHILDALDGALASWDRDHPELFHQTLELNFPALVRRSSV